MKKYIVTALIILLTGFKSSEAQQKNGLLWEISGNGMAHPAYLFGTIHMYDTTLYHLPAVPFSILDKVKKVYFELDLGNIDAAAISEGLFSKDSSQFVDKLLDAESLAKLKVLIAGSANLAMLGDQAYSIKPILLWSILMGDGGKTPSLDMELYKAAAAKKDSVGGLETVKEEMDALDKIPVTDQIKMLQESLKVDFSPKESLMKMTRVYVKQNIGTLMTDLSYGETADANFNEHLLVKRNIVMVDRITAFLGKQSVMINVGGGHLAGSTGLIALLEKRGYKLKNIPFNFEAK